MLCSALTDIKITKKKSFFKAGVNENKIAHNWN